MEEFSSRTAAFYGREAVEILKKKAVIVFGIGGVGGFVVEALARTGVGRIGLVDFDTVSESNLNRQIIALRSTVGRPKTDVMAERIADICPDCAAERFCMKLTEETLPLFRLADWDCIVDAIDDVPAKILLLKEARALNVPVISSMGTGNKKDPCAFQVADISKTHSCPLARTVRRELGKAGVKGVPAVFSTELPRQEEETERENGGRRPPSSVIFAPAGAGLKIASAVVDGLLGL